MLTELRLFVLSVVVVSQVSWLVSVPRGKMFVHSQNFSSDTVYFVAAQTFPQFAILLQFLFS